MAHKAVEIVLYIAVGFLIGYLSNDVPPACGTDTECMEMHGGDGSPE